MSMPPRRRLRLAAAGLLVDCSAKRATGSGASETVPSLSARVAGRRPRLLVTPDHLVTLETRLARDETGRRWRAALFAQAERLHALPPVA